jgi:cell division protein FtsB
MLTKPSRMASPPKKKKTTRVKLKRLEAQTRVICTFNRIVFGVMALVLAMVVVASALPQRRRLTELEDKLQRVLSEEKKVDAERDYRETEYRAMKDDPAFLELKAMDRLNLRRDGEKIYRFKREGE